MVFENGSMQQQLEAFSSPSPPPLVSDDIVNDTAAVWEVGPPLWERAAQTTSLVVIFLTSAMLNFLLSFVLCRLAAATPSNRLLLSLVMTNFLSTVLLSPFAVVSTLRQPRWIFAKSWCQFTGFVFQAAFHGNNITMATIALDRFYAIVKPIKYGTTVTRANVSAALIFLWVYVAVGAAFPFFGLSEYAYVYQPAKCMCVPMWQESRLYSGVMMITSLCLPFVVMSVCYVEIYHIQSTALCGVSDCYDCDSKRWCDTRQQRRAIHRPPSRTACTILLVLLTYLASVWPQLVVTAAETLTNWMVPDRFQAVAVWLVHAGTITSPLVYGLYNQHIRRHLFALVCGVNDKNGTSTNDSCNILEFLPAGRERRFKLHSQRDYLMAGDTDLQHGKLRVETEFGECTPFHKQRHSQDSGACLTTRSEDGSSTASASNDTVDSSGVSSEIATQSTTQHAVVMVIQAEIYPEPVQSGSAHHT